MIGYSEKLFTFLFFLRADSLLNAYLVNCQITSDHLDLPSYLQFLKYIENLY